MQTNEKLSSGCKNGWKCNQKKKKSNKGRTFTTRTEGKLGGKCQNLIPQKACTKRKELGKEKLSSFECKINQN